MTNRIRMLSNRGGMKTYIEDNPHEPDNPIVHEMNDVSGLVAQAKIMRDDVAPGKDWRHVAVIPPFVFNQMVREGWLHDEKRLRRWANDPDNAAFRTWRGRL